ncbi:hypothetical protein KCG44_08495 [Pacificimonas sp. WHA3]|uniref:PEP-CTERM protein-sorting domain-containing protein n=1 Tax=Pacificimonas pallii TaxID=2827236 RepID=A0ABS6SEP0_9SPHN|nr:hypothetical protein [Pacificimonas pallii]MBV7256825.1 hypothetical protein [Pacificimonas pallii]
MKNLSFISATCLALAAIGAPAHAAITPFVQNVSGSIDDAVFSSPGSLIASVPILWQGPAPTGDDLNDIPVFISLDLTLFEQFTAADSGSTFIGNQFLVETQEDSAGVFGFPPPSPPVNVGGGPFDIVIGERYEFTFTETFELAFTIDIDPAFAFATDPLFLLNVIANSPDLDRDAQVGATTIVSFDGTVEIGPRLAVPAPPIFALLGLGVLGLALRRRGRQVGWYASGALRSPNAAAAPRSTHLSTCWSGP